jgi:hypothetical protein
MGFTKNRPIGVGLQVPFTPGSRSNAQLAAKALWSLLEGLKLITS